MTHLTNKAREIVHKFKTEGFNGVSAGRLRIVNEELTEEDKKMIVESGEKTQEELDNWLRDYAIFVVEADLYYGPATNAPYNYSMIDYDGFYRDLKQYIQKEMGQDVEVKFYEGAEEFECQRSPV